MARRGTPQVAAIRSITASFAAPSTGGAATRTSTASLRTPQSSVRRARGMTRRFSSTPVGVGRIAKDTKDTKDTKVQESVGADPCVGPGADTRVRPCADLRSPRSHSQRCLCALRFARVIVERHGFDLDEDFVIVLAGLLLPHVLERV